MLLAKLNGLKVEATYVGNAVYLKTFTKEKLYIIAGPEFGDWPGKVLAIVTTLYGLHISGARFHEKVPGHSYVHGISPMQSWSQCPDEDCGRHYKYMCMYVNNLATIMKDPSAFFAELKCQKYKLEGIGDISYHLKGYFYRDPDGTLTWGAKSYCKCIIN